MLLILAGLVIITTASLTIARVVVRSQLEHTAAQAHLVADDLLVQAESLTLAWLASEANNLRLPIEAAEPRVDILHEAWETQSGVVTVAITAFDQAGMVPAQLVTSPVGEVLPAEVVASLSRSSVVGSVDGLDVLAVDDDAEVRVFPAWIGEPPVWMGGNPGSTNAATETRDDSTLIAIGTLVATHPRSTARPVHSGAQTTFEINAATAPRLLIDAIAALGDIELPDLAALRNQDSDRRATVPNVSIPVDNTTAVRLVSTSRCWAMRTDLSVNGYRASWWTVFERSAGGWQVVQRLRIKED